MNTETGEVRSQVTAEELAELIGRLGGEGDRFVVVERLEGERDHYIQTWHEGDGPYEVEYRAGAPERHFGVRMDGAEAVVAVFLAWARGTEGWADGHAWERVELSAADDEDGLPLGQELLEEAEDQARLLIRCGFDTAEEIAEDVSDYFYADGETPVSPAAAREIVDRLWRERLAEQETWPEVTDADRVAAAFAALEADGVTARMHFTCCTKCGFAEIGAEAAEGDHGFVFFPCQDTEKAAEGHGLWLAYGAHLPGPEDGGDEAGMFDSGTGEARSAGGGTAALEATAAVGREVVTALTAAGLSVVWDGDPDRAIRVQPLDWRRRLPVR
ncbi:DUF6891 domain-containing protein [Streptomyces stramineus]